MLLQINNLTKLYKSESKEDKFALNNVSLSFDSAGLVCIVGKSGSGKSTLLNMMGLFDTPTSGNILFNNKNIFKYKKKDKEDYRRNHISIIFQHYHLLDDEIVLFNVMLPSLMAGNSKNKAQEKALSLFEGIAYPKELLNRKCSLLSGGEKQRVAILRALINSPEIILADEPTGALDSANSIMVMDILKQASKDKLVIVVTHNNELAKKYADRIIEIGDGKIIKDTSKKKKQSPITINSNHKSGSSDWINQIVKTNFKKRFKRNIVSLISLVVGLVSSLLIIGFSNGATSSIKAEVVKQLDYGVFTVSKETNYAIENSPISIVQLTRPSIEEIDKLQKDNPQFAFSPNFEALIPTTLDVSFNNERQDELYYHPIYSYVDSSFDSSLLMDGRFPYEDSLDEVVINQTAKKYFEDKYKINPLNQTIKISHIQEVNYYTADATNPYVTDYFVYEKNIKIVGVVKELSFLSTAKIYYPYTAVVELLQNTILNNLSTYKEEYINWFDYIINLSDTNQLTSYSYHGFLKDYTRYDDIEILNNKLVNDITLDSSSLTISSALFDLVKASTIGMEIFLIIALLGTALILGIVSFSSYTEDKKNSAILSSLGAKEDDISNIFVFESIIIGVISLIFSIILSILFAKLLNFILFKLIGFSNMVVIPYSSFLNKKFLLINLMILATIFVCTLSTYLPIIFSHKISIKDELADE